MRNIIFVLIFILITGKLFSQPVESNTGVNNGYIMSIARDASTGNLYAGTVGRGVYKSTNNGSSWSEISSGIPLIDIIIYYVAVNHGKIYFVSEENIYISTDEGSTWSKMNSGLPFDGDEPPVKFLVSDGDYIYAGTSKGLYRLRYNENYWTNINIGIGDYFASAIKFSGSKIILGTYNKGVFFSIDGGGTWTPGSNGLSDGSENYWDIEKIEVNGSNIFAATYNGVYVTSDDGVSWSLTASAGFPNDEILTMASSGTTIFAGTEENGLYKSENSGASWTASSIGMSFPNTNDLIVNGTEIIAATYGGVYFSYDNGNSWIARNMGIKNLWVRDIATEGSNIYAAGFIAGVYHSADAGASWTLKKNGLVNTWLTCIATSGTKIFAGTEGGGVFYSSDNGNNWIQSNNGLTNPYVYDIVIDGVNLYAVTDGGLFYSNNSGSSWTSINNGLTESGISNIVIKGSKLFASGWNLFTSIDNGLLWTQVPGISGVDAILVKDNDIIVHTYSGLYKSSNDGATWSLVGSLKRDVLTLITNGSLIFAGTYDGLYASADNGISWSVVPGWEGMEVYSPTFYNNYLMSGFNYWGIWKESLDDMKIISVSTNWMQFDKPAAASGNLTISSNTTWTVASSESWLTASVSSGSGNATVTLNVTENTTEYQREALITVSGAGCDNKIIKLNQNGVNFWQEANNGLRGNISAGLSLFTADTETGYMYTGGSGFIYRSTDDGNTWEDINTSQLQNISVLAAGMGKILAGTGLAGIYVSENNGDTWAPSNNGMAATGIKDIAVTSNGLLAGTTSGIFLSTDGGKSWMRKNNGLITTNINDIYSDGFKLFAGTYGGGVFMSADNGNTWTAIKSGLSGQALYVNSVIRLNNRLVIGTGDKIYVSDNEGTTWTQSATGITPTSIRSVTELYGTLYAATTAGIYYSTDSGSTWTLASAATGSSLGNYNGTLYLWGGALYKSFDGLYWDQFVYDIKGSSITTIVQKGNIIFAGTDMNEIFKSADNGTTWVRNPCMHTVKSIIISGNRIYASGSNKIMYSDDDGANWVSASTGLSAGNYVLAETSGKLFAGSYNGIFKSEDQGGTWIAVNTGLATAAARNILQIISKGSVLFIITNDGSFRSDNFGSSWVQMPRLSNSTTTIRVIDGKVFAASGSMLVSENDGLSWTMAGPLPSGSVLSFFKNDNNIYAATSAGIFISQDNMKSWKSMNAGLRSIYSNSLFATSEYIFAGTRYSGVWRQKLAELSYMSALPVQVVLNEAAGSTAHIDVVTNSSWTLQSSEPWLSVGTGSGTGNAGITVTAAANTSRVSREAVITLSGKGAGNKTIVASQDGISDWEEINKGVYGAIVQELIADPVSGKIYAATQGAGLYVSADDGLSWNAINNGMLKKDIMRKVLIKGNTIIAGTSASGLFVSHDNGASFAAPDAIFAGSQVSALENTGSYILAAAAGKGIFRSSDDGNTWVFSNPGLPATISVSALLYVNGNVLAGTSSGIYISADNGVTWSTSNTGFPGIYNITSMAYDGTAIYSGCSFGIFKSTDNGATWSASSSGLANNTLIINRIIIAQSKLYAATPGGLVVSTNSGSSWTLLSAPINAAVSYPIAFLNGNLFAGSYQDGIFRSSDEGTTWIKTNYGLTNTTIYGVSASTDNLYSISRYGIFKSGDKGMNWSSCVLPPGNVYSVENIGNALFAGMGSSQLYKSSDGGTNWINTNSGLNGTVLCMIIKGNAIYAGTTHGVYISEDCGINWTQNNTGLSTPIQVNDILLKGDDFYIATSYNGIFLLKSSSSVWQPVSSGLPVPALTVNTLLLKDNFLFVGTGIGTYRSADGLTWTAANEDISGKQVRTLVQNDNRIYASTSNGMYFSDDNAFTWASMNSGLDIYGLSVTRLLVYQGYLYAGTEYNGMWRYFISEQYLYPSSTTITIDQDAGSTGLFDITSNTGWSLSCNDQWLTIVPGSGSNNSGVMLIAQANNSVSERSAKITISGIGIETVTVMVNQRGMPLGILKNEILDVVLYPVPANNTLWIDGLREGSRVSLYDIKGTLLRSWSQVEGFIELEGLPAGSYLLRLDLVRRTVMKRFIKQ